MKKLLTFLLVMICLHTMAQTTITQIPPGQIIKQQEAMKKVAEKRAAIDKVLNATIKQADFIVRNYTRHAKYVFGKLTVFLIGNNDSKFNILAYLKDFEPQMNYSEDVFVFSGNAEPSRLNNCPKGIFYGTTYKDMLQNGFLFKASFSDRLPTSPVKPGQSWGCNFFISFLFTDGTKVEVPLQDFFAGNGTMWKSNDNLKAERNIPGSAFPDPANPLVLPPVK
jgi:hypothetical protein